MGLYGGLLNKILRSRVYFIALNIDEAFRDETEIRKFVALLNFVHPISNDEQVALDVAIATGDERLLKNWYVQAFKQRHGFDYVDVLPLKGRKGREAVEQIHSQPWFRSCRATAEPTTEAYGTLLSGLRQAVMLAMMPERFNDIWRQLTVTLGPVPQWSYDPEEPLNIATRKCVSEGVTIVVAAGNEGRLIRGNSLNPWACPPWVISVGATTKDGSRLLETSSRGIECLQYDAPTVVAPGASTSESGLPHVHKVTLENLAVAPAGAFQMVVDGEHVYNYQKEHDGVINVEMMIDEHRSSPAVRIEVMLEWLKKNHGSRNQEVTGTSFAAEYVAGLLSGLALHVKLLMPKVERSLRPALLKTMIEDMAQPMPAYKPWEVGKGLVTDVIASQYINDLHEQRLHELVARARKRLSEQSGQAIPSLNGGCQS